MLNHPEVRFEVTDLCNAHCVMCPREKHDRKHGVMDQAQYEASVDEIVTLGAKRIVLTGFGEPLLDNNLSSKVEYASNYGLGTYIITNASKLTTDVCIRLLTSGLSELRISFYGMAERSYNMVMRNLDFKTSLNGVHTFLNVRRILKKQCKVQISYLVLPENKDDVETFKSYWRTQVDAIEVWHPHNFGDGKDYRERTDIKTSCGRPKSGPLQIQWDGTVVPCCYDYNNQIVLGNAFETPIMAILKGGRYEALRQAHEKGEFHKFPYCDQCDQLLPHDDALVYTNRHTLPNEVAVKLSNTDLYNFTKEKEVDTNDLTDNYNV